MLALCMIYLCIVCYLAWGNSLEALFTHFLYNYMQAGGLPTIRSLALRQP